MSTTTIRVRFQTDEGFLPREYPPWKREFNGFGGEAAGDAAEPTTYHCPYCSEALHAVVMSALDWLNAAMRRVAQDRGR